MRWIIAALISIGFVCGAAAFDVPALGGRVTDRASLLSASQIFSLTERIRAIEEKNGDGAQVAVVTLPSLNGESIDQVGPAILHEWKLGRKGRDNGVLLIAAPNERKVRIEVGYGLEAVLADGVTARIIAEQMRPHLKRGADDWFAAFDGAVAAIGAAIPDRASAGMERRASGGFGFFILCVLGIVAPLSALFFFVTRRPRKLREAARAADTLRASAEAARQQRPAYAEPPFRAGPPHPARTSATAAGLGALAGGAASRRKEPAEAARTSYPSSRSDDSYSSSWGGSSSSCSSSFDSGSSYSGGGGDSGGDGSSSDV